MQGKNEAPGVVAAQPGGKQFSITRSFDAPRELVYEVWTKAEHLAKWWGPAGMKIDIKQFEFTPGGIFHYSMDMPGGGKMWGKFVYRDMLAPERIVFISSFSDAEGGITRAPLPNAENFPLEVHNTVTFTEEDGKTTVTITGGPINATDVERAFYESLFGSMQNGFGGTFDRLAEYLTEMN